jgi:hypothetical protein
VFKPIGGPNKPTKLGKPESGRGTVDEASLELILLTEEAGTGRLTAGVAGPEAEETVNAFKTADD